MNLDEALPTFIVEARELLQEMESALQALAKAEAREKSVHAMFRAAHTIKGSAGLFGLERVVAIAHKLERALDRVRGGAVELSDELTALLSACCRHIGALIGAVEAGQTEADAAMNERNAALVEQLSRYLGEPAEQRAPSPAEREARVVERIGQAGGGSDQWHISLRFGRDVLRDGMDPLSFIRYLGTLGTVTAIVTIADGMPAAAEMDPEACYLGFEIALSSDADKAAIESTFEFVRDDCDVRILPPHSRASDYMRLIDELAGETTKLGEILLRCGCITAHELDAALAAQAGIYAADKLGEILIELGAVRPAVVEAALAKQGQSSKPKIK